MTLTLPQDAEPHIPDGGDLSDLSTPGVYVLDLTRPADAASAWDACFDHRPDYWDAFVHAARVCYVGASPNVLRRLEEHRDGEVRQAVLCEVCDIDGVRDIRWFDDADAAFQAESRIAIDLQTDHPGDYIHMR